MIGFQIRGEVPWRGIDAGQSRQFLEFIASAVVSSLAPQPREFPAVCAGPGITDETDQGEPVRRHPFHNEIAGPHGMPGEERGEESLKPALTFQVRKEPSVEEVEPDAGDDGEKFPGENGREDPKAPVVKVIDVWQDDKVMEENDEAGSPKGRGDFPEDLRSFLKVPESERRMFR